MSFLLRTSVACLYVALLPARVLGPLLGRDPLRLRKPKGDTYWVKRPDITDMGTYYTESSPVEESWGASSETRSLQRVARYCMPLFMTLARLCAPKRSNAGAGGPSVADKDIPDEIYTLW